MQRTHSRKPFPSPSTDDSNVLYRTPLPYRNALRFTDIDDVDYVRLPRVGHGRPSTRERQMKDRLL